MFKKLKLYTLPTNKKPYSLQKWGQWWFNTADGVYSNREPKPKGHDLYLTIEEEVERGNWILVKTIIGFQFVNINDKLGVTRPLCIKVVATTNLDIIHSVEKHKFSVCPCFRIPTSLVDYFVKTQGEIIEVEVKYKEIHPYGHLGGPSEWIPDAAETGEIEWRPLKVRTFTEQQIKNAYLAGESMGKTVARNEDYYSFTSPFTRAEDWLSENYPDKD